MWKSYTKILFSIYSKFKFNREIKSNRCEAEFRTKFQRDMLSYDNLVEMREIGQRKIILSFPQENSG